MGLPDRSPTPIRYFSRRPRVATRLFLLALFALSAAAFTIAQPTNDVSGPLNLSPPAVSSDKSVKLDYDIVYVRMPRKGDGVGTNWTEISNPVFMDAGADLILL